MERQLTGNLDHYVDPILNLTELHAAQEERASYRSDTDDDDRGNDEILDGLLRRDDGVANEQSS